MADRDPAFDPEPGDVLRQIGTGEKIEVIAVDNLGETVITDCNGARAPWPLSTFRAVMSKGFLREIK